MDNGESMLDFTVIRLGVNSFLAQAIVGTHKKGVFFEIEANSKIKVIQGIFKQNVKPKCQIKWEEQYGGNIDWTQIWTKLKKIKVTNKVNCSLSLIFKVTLRSGTIVVSPFKTFMNFSGISFFNLRKL
jgi:hypothetical protein